MSQGKMNICWNTHRDSLGTAFPRMLDKGKFVDVSLVCGRRQIRCHQIVLAACSSYFAEILEENPAPHPIIILPRDVKFWTIHALVDFMYKGEVSVAESDFEELVRCAEMLEIHSLYRVSPHCDNSNYDQREGGRGMNMNTEYGNYNLKQEARDEDREENNISMEPPLEREIPLHIIPEFSADVVSKICRKERSQRTPWKTSPKLTSEPSSSQWNQNHTDSYEPYESLNVDNDLLENPSVLPRLKTEDPMESYHENMNKTINSFVVNSPAKIKRSSKKFLRIPPKNFKLGKSYNQRSYDAKTMWSALMSVKSGMSANKASKLYKVPRLSLHTYMKRYGIKSYFPQPSALKQHNLTKNTKK